MSDVILTHFEPSKLGVSHWVCAECGEVFAADSIEWVWDGKTCTHIPKCPVCGNAKEGDVITLNGTVLELAHPVLKLRTKKRKVWIDVEPYLTKAGKLSTRKKVEEDEEVFKLTKLIAERERRVVTGNEDMPTRVIFALDNLFKVGSLVRIVKKREIWRPWIKSVKLEVLKLLVRSDRMHPIRQVGSWHGDPTRKTRKGFDGKFVNMGMWINAMEVDFAMFDKAMDNAVNGFEFWTNVAKRSPSKWNKRRAADAERNATELIGWRECLNKAGYLSMNRGVEIVDPADNKTRYTRWWDPTKERLIKTGKYDEHRIVRYIDEMGGDESDDSIARTTSMSPDEAVATTEDTDLDWIRFSKPVRGYDKILKDEVLIGFDDTDTDPSCWVPDEVPNNFDMNGLREFARTIRL